MLAKNSNLSQTLEEDNFSLEAEFINRLKDAETVPPQLFWCCSFRRDV